MQDRESLIKAICTKIKAEQSVSNTDLGITANEFNELLDYIEYDRETQSQTIHSEGEAIH